MMYYILGVLVVVWTATLCYYGPPPEPKWDEMDEEEEQLDAYADIVKAF